MINKRPKHHISSFNTLIKITEKLKYKISEKGLTMTESLTRWQGKKLAWIYHPLLPTGTFKTFLSVRSSQATKNLLLCIVTRRKRERELCG